MAAQPNLLPLKLLVISLGVVLLAGLGFVLGTIAARAQGGVDSIHCADAELHIGAGTISSITPQGREVQVTVANGQASKVLTVERCTGHVLQTLTVMP